MSIENKASSVVKVKPSSNQDGPSKGKVYSTSFTKKKIEGSIKQPDADSKNKFVSKSIKSEENAYTIASSTKTATKTVKTTVRRERKVYSLPGQKYDPPEEREPLRIFYESLSKQLPSSEMAEFWLMEHGLLSPERARKALEKKQWKQKHIRMGTPVKSPTPTSKLASSVKQQLGSKNGEIKAKKRIINDSDDEYIASSKRRK
ncbi:hypothetical protein Nepgr_014260 [Nepenthes gracilis]|uniref:Uncharacterized protein n=1 Tax=Nepenthes gracilis TaxID=150966 RepID=A0AAD3XPZ2_NEPGR|nr:hypothetical protein Nepgr_014260 [Nepenthes gracilis]